MTEPLTADELAAWHAGTLAMTLDDYPRLLATLAQALARCERAEKRVEELTDFHVMRQSTDG